MTVKFTNNASTTVGTGINASATSLTVASASSFPSLSGADDYCYLTIQQSTGTVREVVKATALSGNTFTIVRAQDNTSAGTWSAGDIVELRMTAALLTDVIDAATVEGVKTNFQYTPTAGQTVFSGADNASNTMIINQAALVSVYLNGIRLVQGSDYSVSSANNTVTLTAGVTTADIVDVEVFGNFTGQSGAAVAITGGAISGASVAATTLSASGTATLNTFVSSNATISGGTINNVNIGGTTAGTVAATTLAANSISSGAITSTGAISGIKLEADSSSIVATPGFRSRVNHGGQSFQQLTGLSHYWNTSNGSHDNSLVYGASANSYLDIIHADGSAFHTRLRIDASGNLGLGITPRAKVDIFGTGAGNARVLIEGEGGADPYINFLANNTQHWSIGIDDSDADKFKISKHSTLGTNDYFVVDVSGNATFSGTISSGAITSSGDIDTTGLLKVGVNDTEYANNYLRFKSAGDAFFDHHTTGQKLRFRVSNSSALDTTPLILDSDGTATFGGNVKASDIIASGSGGLALQTDEGTKRLLVKDNGEVKIGTTAVASATTAPLHVAAPSTDVQAIFGDNLASIDDPQIRVIGRNSANSAIRYLFTGLDADANHGFIGYNAGAGAFVNGLEFHTDGVVTAPKLPAFRAARSTSDYSHTTGNPVQFNTTGSTLHFDTGNDYSTTTYRFTAPVAGVYTFHCVIIWSGLSDGNSMIDSFRFRVNGSTLGGYSERRAVYKTDITGTAGYFVESATDTYKLSAQDYVEVIGQKSLTIHGNHQYTRFTGYLVG